MEQVFPCTKKWSVPLDSDSDLELIVEFTGYTTGKVISVNEKSRRYIETIHKEGKMSSSWVDIRDFNRRNGYWVDHETYMPYDPTQQEDLDSDI